MPTYKNTNANDIAISGYRIPGRNGTVAIQHYLLTADLPAGVTKISDAPYWNQTVISTVYTGNNGDSETVDIPQTINSAPVTAIKGQIYCRTGSVSITFNSASNTPAIILKSGFMFSLSTMERNINDIRISYTSDNTELQIDFKRNR